MAILKTITVHRSLPDVIGAYLMIGVVQHDLLSGEVGARLVCFASLADRETLRQARADVALYGPAVEAGEPAPVAMPDKPTVQQINAVAAQRQQQTADWITAQANLLKAQAALSSVQPIQPLGLAMDCKLPPACLTNGAVDLAKAYGWLKANGYDGEAV